MFIKGFIYKLYEREKKSIDIYKTLIASIFNLEIPFIEILKNDIYSETKEKEFLNTIDDLNKLFKKKKIAENKVIIDLNNKEVELMILNADRSFFDIDFFRIIGKDKMYFKHLSSGEQKISLLFGKLNYVVRKFYMEDKDNFYITFR